MTSSLGQSAIEYLMTYGWMLIVVSIAGGAIYNTAGSQCTESVSGFGDSIDVDDFGLSSDNELDLVIQNADSSEVTVNSVTVQGSVNDTTETISVGGSEAVSVPEFARSSSCNTLDVEVEYDAGGLEGLVSEGSVTGQYEQRSVETPSINSVDQ